MTAVGADCLSSGRQSREDYLEEEACELDFGGWGHCQEVKMRGMEAKTFHGEGSFSKMVNVEKLRAFKKLVNSIKKYKKKK